LSPSTQRVLGFESAPDWTNASSVSTVRAQGDYSIAVPVSGWTEVQSGPLSTIGAVDDTATVAVQLPASVAWEEARLIVKIPSQSEWYRELGSQPLAALSAGTFHTLEFSIPPDLATKFEGNYTDLTFTVVINAPAGEYLLDALSPCCTNTIEPRARPAPSPIIQSSGYPAFPGPSSD